MRKLKLAFGICLMVVFLISCKTIEVNVVKQTSLTETAYTYVGIDPSDVSSNWEEAGIIPVGPGMFEFCYRNPDIDSPFTFAILLIYGDYRILGYSYICDGEIDVCLFNVEANAYESTYDKSDKELVLLWKDKYNTYFGLNNI